MKEISKPRPYTEEAKRLRWEIKKKFKTQVSLCQAIGAKDSSIIAPYIAGYNRIGNILRDRLEAVGIDVNYILYGKKGSPELPSPPPDQNLDTLLTQCSDKIQHLQGEVISINNELLELNKLFDTIKKRLSS